MNLAPIVVIAYNRPTHLDRTLESLSKNDYAKDSILYIYCDGPKPFEEIKNFENAKPLVVLQNTLRVFQGTNAEYKEYLSNIDKTRSIATKITGFKEVYVIKRDTNIGLADNIVSAVTEIVNKYGKVIVFEDDIVSTRGCLKYLNDALNLYENDEKVMHVSAWMFPNKGQFPTTFFYDSPYPAGGWATWDRAWRYYNGDTKNHVDYWNGNWKKFDIEGQNHLSKQLLMNLDGRLKTWYIKWYSSVRRCGGLCLYPGTSMTNNIGWDCTGETSYSTNRYYVPQLAQYTNVERVKIIRNNKAFNFIRIWYSGHWYSKRYRQQIINKIKSIFRVKF